MKEIFERLIQLKDDEYKEFNKKLCPDTNREMLGIRVPYLRKLAKEIVLEYDWEKYIKSKVEYFEEVLLQGMIIGYAKLEIEEKILLIKEFVPKIDSWAINDTFCPSLNIKKKDLEKVWDFIIPYTKSEKEFEVRFAVIMMLDYYITDEYVDKVIKLLDEINHNGYYVKMGVAWTIAEIGIKFETKAMKYLQNNNHLDKFTFNKSLQKMIESNRIPNIKKDALRKMKRK